ncbi:hypothetical protein ASPCAL13310 [Aspergillus calidoustus]|uniref:DUF6536 domain-containing protein n=1 Tax=Aspergillus calidoustus TaxID=454130 RepID=A0A0U5CHD3_ASPCI|nr:hypothetical protein ASPCAL13310 [Aspergillus calidoustus]
MGAWDSSPLKSFTYTGLCPAQQVEESERENEASDDKQPHWIRGVHICAALSSSVLLVNLILLIIAIVLSRRIDDNAGLSSGDVIYDGSCSISKRWDTALHLLINVLSTTIIAASNYTMQTLVAPSREEVDRAHGKGQWLDIGTPSTRNLFVVGSYRVWLWVVLLVTATPFHLLYNSVVFGAIGTNEYSVVLAPSDLGLADARNYTTPGLESCFNATGMSWGTFTEHLSNGTYRRVDADECFDLTMATRSHGMRTVVGLSDELSVQNGGDFAFLNGWTGTVVGRLPVQTRGAFFSNRTWAFTLPTMDGADSPVYSRFNFTLSDCLSANIISGETACADGDQLATWLARTYPQTLDNVTAYIGDELATPIAAQLDTLTCEYEGGEYYATNGCLILETEDRCKLVYNLPLCIVVIAAAAVKIAAMFLAARLNQNRTPPLLTVGDAVASFMGEPDPTTLGRCWITRHDVRDGTWSSPSRSGGQKLRPRGLWIQAASFRRWMITLLSCGATIGVGIYLLLVATEYLGSLSTWWTDYGFGEYSKDTYPSVDLERLASAPALATVLVANTPQFAVTVSYYFYNNVLTTMLASAEYDSYGVRRAGLRVSWPKKNTSQRSTYWLSIPYKYCVPLLVTYMALHWTVSQSLFYVLIVPYGPDLQIDSSGAASSLAYSPVAILVSIILGGVMVTGLLIMALFRRYRSVLPLAGSCSIAISAACHVGSDEDPATAAMGEVMWGVTSAFPAGVEAPAGVGHCSFSSEEVERTDMERSYM